jgi:hypothetical protein
MIVWGGLHGLYQIGERIPLLWRPIAPPKARPVWRQLIGAAIVFSLVILAWVPFRWGLPAAFDFWAALLNWSHAGIRYRRLLLILPVLLGSVLLDWAQYRNQDEFIFLKWPPLAKAACIAVVLFGLFIVTGGDFEPPFIYQAF